MNALTDDQRSTLRAALEREWDRIEANARASEATLRSVQSDQCLPGSSSRLDALQDPALSANLTARDQERARRIARALERMDAGTYGTCTRCGASMPFRRLAVVPDAPTCQACA